MEKENTALKSNSEKLKKEILLEAPMGSECVSKTYEMSFQKYLARKIDRSTMASMIYGVSRNGKRGNGSIPPKNSMFKYKSKEMIIKPKVLYSYFTYGHSHIHDTYFAQKSWVDKTIGKTNHKWSKKMWVPKNRIIYVADILSNKVDTPVMVPGLWVISTHDRKKVDIPRAETKAWRFCRLWET